jgi:hypothetical protein
MQLVQRGREWRNDGVRGGLREETMTGEKYEGE